MDLLLHVPARVRSSDLSQTVELIEYFVWNSTPSIFLFLSYKAWDVCKSQNLFSVKHSTTITTNLLHYFLASFARLESKRSLSLSRKAERALSIETLSTGLLSSTRAHVTYSVAIND